MAKSVTTTLRLTAKLRRRIDRRAATLGCAKNHLIVSAIERYLVQEEQAGYEDEMRRQSLLAAKLDRPDPGWDKLVEELWSKLDDEDFTHLAKK